MTAGTIGVLCAMAVPSWLLAGLEGALVPCPASYRGTEGRNTKRQRIQRTAHLGSYPCTSPEGVRLGERFSPLSPKDYQRAREFSTVAGEN